MGEKDYFHTVRGCFRAMGDGIREFIQGLTPGARQPAPQLPEEP
jgi:hypothetical protein